MDYTKFLDFLLSNNKIVGSIVAVLLVIVVRVIVISRLNRLSVKQQEDKRDLINSTKNTLSFLLLITLIFIWAAEIQNLAISIAAFVVAIVIATREFIQCVIGFIYSSSTRPFRVGDWVQIGNYHGEVAGNDWMKVTLLEVDLSTYDYTGKTLTLPNNLLITSPIKNLNFLKRYVMHKFTITRDESVNVFEFKEELLEKARAFCSEFKDVAQRYNQLIEKKLDVPISGPEPTVKITTSDLGNTQVSYIVFCPTEKALEIEQKITRNFMTIWYQKRQEIDKPEQ